MAKTRIKCYKYNHALDSIVQNLSSQMAFIELSKDFQDLKITNRVPKDKIEYVLESDPQYVK